MNSYQCIRSVRRDRNTVVSILAPTRARLRSLFRLEWYQWIKVGGATGLAALGTLLLAGYIPHPVTVAALLHLVTDFTLQSQQTAINKEQRDRHLVVHALVAGGLPLAIAALMTGDPLAVVVWAALGVTSHYVVDWTRKFGVRRVALAVLLDQACHLLTIVFLALMR
jgi:hypothetical protein